MTASGKSGDPGGIRTPDPQIRNVADGAENRQISHIPAENGPNDPKGLAGKWESPAAPDGAQGRNPISAENRGSGTGERQSVGDGVLPGSVVECLSMEPSAGAPDYHDFPYEAALVELLNGRVLLRCPDRLFRFHPKLCWRPSGGRIVLPMLQRGLLMHWPITDDYRLTVKGGDRARAIKSRELALLRGENPSPWSRPTR